ncbi:winged helix-turn-helix transcriptional regulator [Pannonibacter sp. Q-1]
MSLHLGENQCQRISEVLARVGDKWSVTVILTLGEEPRRFNALKRSIGVISQRMLTMTLRGLERDGLVRRNVFEGVPLKVEYELTDLGRSFMKTLGPVGDWAIANLDRIDAARDAFDAKGRESMAWR